MPHRKTLVVSSAIVLTAAAVAHSTHAAQLPDYAKTLAELVPTGGAGGSGNAWVQVVTILGNPSLPGPYSQLLKVAPHAQIAAHHHAGDRVGTVLQGTWMFGYGPSFDKARLRILPVGSVYTEPSDGAHFAATGDEAATVLITGLGPTNTVYENPADDPTAQQ